MPTDPTPEQLDQWARLCAAARIADFPMYRVTRDGDVFAVGTNWRGLGVRRLRPAPNGHGYATVRMIRSDGRRVRCAIHRLVAAAFLPPRPSPRHQIRHLNADKSDARAVNLAWGTARDNALDRASHGRTAVGEHNGAARLTIEQVEAARRRVSAGESRRSVARDLGVDSRTINNVIAGRSWLTRAAALRERMEG